MDADFANLTDDFFVNITLQTTLPLPRGRESVLHFFEAVQKQFQAMTTFYQREGEEYVLEGNRDNGTYPWLELQRNQMTAGYFNPPNLETARHFHRWLLDRSVYFLGVSGLDVETLDVMFGFNMDYRGNRDALVAEALLGGSPLHALAVEGALRPTEFEPSFVVALDEQCYLQARLAVETRGSTYQIRTGQYDDEPISVYFTVRRWPSPEKILQMTESFDEQLALGEDICSRIVVPGVIQPIATAIASH